MALTQISTKGIKDGTILNEDISNSAAIAASKVSGLSTDSIAEGNSKAEVIGIGTNDGEFKVTLQDATSNGAGAVSLHQYTTGSYNITELNPSGGNVSANSSLIFNHLTTTNAWSNILFKKSGASTGESQIRCSAGTSFQFYPQDGNVMLTLNNSASTFANLVQPSDDSTHDLGTNTNRWRNVYADTLYGDGSNLTGISAGTSLSGSTNNTICTVTGANAITGEANLKFDGSATLTIVDTELAEAADNFSVNIQSGNNDFYVKSGGTIFAAFKGLNKDLQLTSGNLIVGTSGKGIDFSAASGSNSGASSSILDDYEEGTFTPTARGNNNNSSPVIQGSGKYTKIGNVVQIQLQFAAENGSYLPSGEYFQIHGLPFTFNGEHYMGYGFNYKVVFNSDYQYLFYAPNGNSRVEGYYNRSDLPYQPWGTDQWDNTQWYHSNTFTYMTDT